MKNVFWILLAFSSTMVLQVVADISSNLYSDKMYIDFLRTATIVDTSTNVAILPANLILFLEKDLGGGAPTNQFLADEMLCEVMTVRRPGLNAPHDFASIWAMGKSNSVYYRGLSSFAQAIDFMLFDDRGREVPKTQKGLDNSQSPKSPKDDHDLSRNFKVGVAHWSLNDVHMLFRPSDMFVITNKGIYDLVVKFRICVAMTNRVPDIKAMTNVNSFLASENFSVFESTPLCVKIIKN